MKKAYAKTNFKTNRKGFFISQKVIENVSRKRLQNLAWNLYKKIQVNYIVKIKSYGRSKKLFK